MDPISFQWSGFKLLIKGSSFSYPIEVQIDGEKFYEEGPVSLENGEVWEQGVNFVLTAPGESQKVEFLLFKNGSVEPSQESLHLWIDVGQ